MGFERKFLLSPVGLPEFAVALGAASIVAWNVLSEVAPESDATNLLALVALASLLAGAATVSRRNAWTVLRWCVVVFLAAFAFGTLLEAGADDRGRLVKQAVVVGPAVAALYVAGAMGLVALPREYLTDDGDVSGTHADAVGADDAGDDHPETTDDGDATRGRPHDLDSVPITSDQARDARRGSGDDSRP